MSKSKKSDWKKPDWKHVPDSWIAALIANQMEEEDFHHTMIHVGTCEVCRERIWDKRREIQKALPGIPGMLPGVTPEGLPTGLAAGFISAIGKMVEQMVGGPVQLVGVGDLSALHQMHQQSELPKGKGKKKKGKEISRLIPDAKAQEWFITFINSVRPFNELERQNALKGAIMIPDMDHVGVCQDCQTRFIGVFDQLHRIGSDLKAKLPADAEIIEEVLTNVQVLKEELTSSIRTKTGTESGNPPDITLS